MRGTLNNNQLSNIEETLEDFKALLARYRSVKDDEIKSKQFFVRNRNPIFDITGCNFFKTGLISESARYISSKLLVDDNYIQRSKAMRIIFSELDNNENMGLNEFILLLQKYCSTIKLSKEEHNKVTILAKQNPNYLNHEIYSDCDIIIDGLSELLLRLN